MSKGGESQTSSVAVIVGIVIATTYLRIVDTVVKNLKSIVNFVDRGRRPVFFNLETFIGIVFANFFFCILSFKWN